MPLPAKVNGIKYVIADTHYDSDVSAVDLQLLATRHGCNTVTMDYWLFQDTLTSSSVVIDEGAAEFPGPTPRKATMQRLLNEAQENR